MPAAQVTQHAQVVQRLDIRDKQLGQGAHARATQQVLGQHGAGGPALLEVLHDGHGLGDDMAIIHQHRRQSLRIEGAELIALQHVPGNVDEPIIAGQALDVQDDAHPMCGDAAMIGIKFHGLLASQSRKPAGCGRLMTAVAGIVQPNAA